MTRTIICRILIWFFSLYERARHMQPGLNCRGFICKCRGTWCFHGNLSAATLLCRLNVVSIKSRPLLHPFITHDGGTQWRTGQCMYIRSFLFFTAFPNTEGKSIYKPWYCFYVFRKSKSIMLTTLILFFLDLQ